jgi:hypothetical protein
MMKSWTILGLVVLAAAAPMDQERALREAIWGDRLIAGTQLYAGLDAPSPQASYLAGWAYWKLHEPEKARPLLKKADQAGFHAGGGRLQPTELLAKIDEYDAAKPPAVEVPGLDRSLIDPYADEKTPLTSPILDALPRIAAIGGQIFQKPPPVRFFLFARKPGLMRFHNAFRTNKAPETGDPHSTGIVNMVVYCEEKAHRPTQSETVSLALHEAVHAWMASYLRRRYDRTITLPSYIDEGLAVYVSNLWSEDVHALAADRLSAWRKKNPAPPAFESLASHDLFYVSQGPPVNYWLADLLAERLLGPPETGAAKIPALLDAYARTGDDAKAWREVTGKDVRAEYQALVSEAWR